MWRRLKMGSAGGLTALLMLGCGASVQVLYEGDVRFEHCMALDAQPSVAVARRRACWQQWVAFYTRGQTRDRVAHAQVRIHELDGVSAFVRPDVGVLRAPLRAPSPLSAHQAPPMMEGMQSLMPAQHEERAACNVDCRTLREGCSIDCDSSICRRGCSVGYNSCVRHCG